MDTRDFTALSGHALRTRVHQHSATYSSQPAYVAVTGKIKIHLLPDLNLFCWLHDQGKELAKRFKCYRYWELGFGVPRRRATIGSLSLSDSDDTSEETKDDKVLDEEIRLLFSEAAASVAFPSSKEAKDANKRKKMMEKVNNEVSTAVSEGKTEITFRKRALENAHIPKNMGKYMKEVKKLVLSDNKLFFFPMALLDMVNLHTLELKNNQIAFLPKDITRLSNLKKLDVENNQLTSLPGMTCSYTFLVSQWYLLAITGEMGSMTQLEDLRLKGNFLDGFLPPEALANQTRGILAYLRWSIFLRSQLSKINIQLSMIGIYIRVLSGAIEWN